MFATTIRFNGVLGVVWDCYRNGLEAQSLFLAGAAKHYIASDLSVTLTDLFVEFTQFFLAPPGSNRIGVSL